MKNKTKVQAKKQEKGKPGFFLSKKFILIALVVNLALRLYIAYQPFEFIDGPFIQDDSYYYLTIAKNIAHGLGPFYTDSYTNGFQPLYAFLITPVFFFTQNDLFAPIRASLVISSIIDTLTLFVLLKIFSKSSRSSLTLLLLSVLWIFNYNVISNTLNGMETSLSMLMIAASFYYFLQLRREDNLRNRVILGVFLGFAVLSRIDNIFIAAAVILFLLIYFKKKNTQAGNMIKSLSTVILAAVIIYLPWAVYSYAYTGSIFPVSGKALRLISYFQVDRNPTYENWYSLLLGASFKIIYSDNFIVLYLFVVNMFVIFLFKKQDKQKTIFGELSVVSFLVISNLILFLSYVFYFFGYWYFSRYFYPMTLMFILLAVISFDYLGTLTTAAKGKLGGFQTVVVLAVLCLSLLTPRFGTLFYDGARTNTGFMNIGLWAGKSFKEGTVVGASQSGAIGYFADKLKVVNLDGVVNKECYDAMEEMRYFDYIKSKKVEYIIGWPSNFTMLRKNSMNFKENEVKPLGKIAEFRTMNTQWLIARVIY